MQGSELEFGGVCHPRSRRAQCREGDLGLKLPSNRMNGTGGREGLLASRSSRTPAGLLLAWGQTQAPCMWGVWSFTPAAFPDAGKETRFGLRGRVLATLRKVLLCQVTPPSCERLMWSFLSTFPLRFISMTKNAWVMLLRMKALVWFQLSREKNGGSDRVGMVFLYWFLSSWALRRAVSCCKAHCAQGAKKMGCSENTSVQKDPLAQNPGRN